MRKVSLQHGLPDGVAAVVTSVVVRAETPNAAPVAYLKTWRAGVDGNWDNASKWAHKGVPNALDRVLIAAAGSYTVTVNSADYAQSVVLDNGTATLSIAAGGDLDVEQGLDVQAGTLALAAGGSLGLGATIEIGQAGTLLDTGAAAIAAAVASSGTIGIAAGVLELTGGGTIGGTVAGGGAIDFAGGTFTSTAAALAGVGGLQVNNGASLMLSGASGTLQASAVDVVSGTIAIAAGATLTLAGDAVFGSSIDASGGSASFNGTLITSGQTTIDPERQPVSGSA